MQKILFFCLLMVLRAQLPAQVLTVADVLKTAAADPRIGQNQSLLTLAQGLKMTDPLLRQIAVRIGTNGSALGDTIYGYLRNEDTYNLIVGFNSLRERKRQQQIKTARVESYIAETRLLEQQALVERYQALAGYLFAEPGLAACRKLDTLLEKEHEILRQMLSTAVLDVKVSKVLDAEEDRNRNLLALRELENAQQLQKNRLRQFMGDFSDLDKTGVANLADLKAAVALLKTTPATHPVFEVKNAETRLEAANLEYITSQNRQIFNNFNAGYQRPLYLERPKRFNTFNNISFRVGLTVPLPGNNRFKKAGALLELREAQNDADWAHLQVEKSLENQFVRLENLFREHALAQDRLDRSLIRRMLDNPQLRAQITPLEIVELEIAQQKLVIAQAGLEADIAVEFVRLLELSGAMSAVPRINYLSGKREGY